MNYCKVFESLRSHLQWRRWNSDDLSHVSRSSIIARRISCMNTSFDCFFSAIAHFLFRFDEIASRIACDFWIFALSKSMIIIWSSFAFQSMLRDIISRCSTLSWWIVWIKRSNCSIICTLLTELMCRDMNCSSKSMNIMWTISAMSSYTYEWSRSTFLRYIDTWVSWIERRRS